MAAQTLDDLPTPALILDRAILRRNLARMSDRELQAIGLGPVKGVAQADKFRAFETIDGRFPGHHAGILSDGLRAIKTIY